MIVNYTREQIEDELRTLRVERFNVPAELITPEAYFFQELGLDSVDLLSAVAILEERHNLAIPDEDLAEMLVFDSAVTHLTKRIHER